MTSTPNFDFSSGLALEQRQRSIDTILNKTVLDITAFSAVGWTLGLAAGIFFHRAAPIRNIFAGIGGSYGFVNNRVALKKYA